MKSNYREGARAEVVGNEETLSRTVEERDPERKEADKVSGRSCDWNVQMRQGTELLFGTVVFCAEVDSLVVVGGVEYVLSVTHSRKEKGEGRETN